MQPITIFSSRLPQLAVVAPRIAAAVAQTAAKIATFCLGVFTSKAFIGFICISCCLVGVATLMTINDEEEFGSEWDYPKPTQLEKQAIKVDQVNGKLKPPPTVVQAGCYNPSNSCWLNSVLKLMTCTPLFDPLLNADQELLDSLKESENAHLKEAVKRLTDILPVLKLCVSNLRDGQAIGSKLADTLRQNVNITGYMQHAGEIGRQHDSSDLLRGLIQDWDTLSKNGIVATPAPKPNFACLYESVGHETSKNPRHDTDTAIMEIGVPPLNENEQASTIDVARTFKAKCYEELELDNSPDKKTYKKTQKLDDNVSTFILNINRVTLVGASHIRRGNPVEIRHDRTLDISGHRFAVKGALHHDGGANGGHWVYLDVNPNGKIYRHSDSHVAKIKHREEAINTLRLATVFFLEKVPVNRV